MKFDFPKECEWILEKTSVNNKDFFRFILYEKILIDEDNEQYEGCKFKEIAYIRRSTPSAMAKAIKALIKKLKTK